MKSPAASAVLCSLLFVLSLVHLSDPLSMQWQQTEQKSMPFFYGFPSCETIDNFLFYDFKTGIPWKSNAEKFFFVENSNIVEKKTHKSFRLNINSHVYL